MHVTQNNIISDDSGDAGMMKCASYADIADIDAGALHISIGRYQHQCAAVYFSHGLYLSLSMPVPERDDDERVATTWCGSSVVAVVDIRSRVWVADGCRVAMGGI